MKIRTAKNDDSVAIARIWNHYITHSIATFNSVEKTAADINAMIQSKRDSDEAFLVSVASDGSIQGFATYGAFRGGVGYAKVKEHTINLSPDHLGKGLGRLLMNAIEKYAASRGIDSLFAGVAAENTTGVNFHKSCQFLETQRINRVGYKFDRWHDLILLRKYLQE